jgi:hypothetical protein
MKRYFVICLDDNGKFVLASRKPFASQEVAEQYARTVGHAREAFVVEEVT